MMWRQRFPGVGTVRLVGVPVRRACLLLDAKGTFTALPRGEAWRLHTPGWSVNRAVPDLGARLEMNGADDGTKQDETKELGG